MSDPLSKPQRETLLYRLAQDYRDLNGTSLETRTHPPSALEFCQIVNVGRPVVFKNTPDVHVLPALSRWTNDYLVNTMGDRKLSIAFTPDGRADALCMLTDGDRCFAEPHTEKLTMSELLHAIKQSEQDSSNEVCYLQSQNGNMYSAADFDAGSETRSELAPLLSDVPREISWASEALDRSPDAVNVWIGGSRSVTSVHSDPYENIYTVVRGAKHFILLPPTEGYTLREQRVPHARYTRPFPSSPLNLERLVPETTVRWASIEPTGRDTGHALRVTVQKGESLYLPAGWWHHVSQTGDDEGICVAINWWYDVEMSGMRWVWMSFLRRMAAPEGDEEQE